MFKNPLFWESEKRFCGVAIWEYRLKSVDMNSFNASYFDEFIAKLNLRPKMCLRWKSPVEVFYGTVLHLTICSFVKLNRFATCRYVYPSSFIANTLGSNSCTYVYVLDMKWLSYRSFDLLNSTTGGCFISLAIFAGWPFFCVSFLLITLFTLYEQIKSGSFFYLTLTLYERLFAECPAWVLYPKAEHGQLNMKKGTPRQCVPKKKHCLAVIWKQNLMEKYNSKIAFSREILAIISA